MAGLVPIPSISATYAQNGGSKTIWAIHKSDR